MENQTTTDAWTMYLYSLKSPVSKQKYPQRLAKFFAFAGLPQDISIEQQSKLFVAKATGQPLTQLGLQYNLKICNGSA
jgi:hypothetical protein